MTQPILLCCDLDRTLLPNGVHEESAGCREIFGCIADRSEIDLTYVSGRDASLIQQAIVEYDIPVPKYAIGDVGTSMYEITEKSEWHAFRPWLDEMAVDWQQISRQLIVSVILDFPGLSLQEPEKQSDFKISFYTDMHCDAERLIDEANSVLGRQAMHVNFIWSIDEADNTGLLDVLPACANKRHAIEFLVRQNNYQKQRTVFAGDSGNDIPVLTSGLPAVLVANADSKVLSHIEQWLASNPEQHSLYIARGDFLGMNGYYSAGILEGLAHFIPETLDWMRDCQELSRFSA